MPPAEFGEEMDAICDRFERAWKTPSETPTPGAFIPAGLDDDETRRLLVELTCIDMEYRWKLDPLASESGDGLPVEPLIEDYIERYPQLGAVDELPQALVTTEYRIRQLHDDRPNASDYGMRFPRLGDPLVRRLRAVAAELNPAIVRCYRRGHLVYSGPFGAELELGRQSQEEPPPYVLRAESDVPKLIVAPLNERHVSRNQLYLAREAVDRIRMENRSLRVRVVVETHGRLTAGVGELFELPVLFHLHGQLVRVEAWKP